MEEEEGGGGGGAPVYFVDLDVNILNYMTQ
jgi:hypothetical protein